MIIDLRNDVARSGGAGYGCRCLRFARIKRRFFGERFRRNFGGNGAVIAHAHHAVVGDATDLRARHIPFVENLAHDFFFSTFHDDQHSLLRFAQQNFVRRHAWFALGHFREIDFHARSAAARGFAGRAGQSRRAHVLNAGDGIRREQFEAGLQEQLFFERIAHLHGWPIFARFFRQLARSKSGAGQTIASRFRADVKDRIADAARGAACELFVPQDAKTKNIYERIAFETFVEINLAADRRDADAIAVMRDPGNDAGEQAAVV